MLLKELWKEVQALTDEDREERTEKDIIPSARTHQFHHLRNVGMYLRTDAAWFICHLWPYLSILRVCFSIWQVRFYTFMISIVYCFDCLYAWHTVHGEIKRDREREGGRERENGLKMIQISSFLMLLDSLRSVGDIYTVYIHNFPARTCAYSIAIVTYGKKCGRVRQLANNTYFS